MGTAAVQTVLAPKRMDDAPPVRVPEGLSVVIVSDFGSINGGASRIAIQNAIGLAERGVPVRFAYAVAPLSSELEHPLIEVIHIRAEEVWQTRNRLSAAANGVWNRRASDEFRQVIAGLDPARTVVHIHQWTKAFSPSVIAAARDAGFRVVVTLHDYFMVCPNGIYYDFATHQPCARKPMSASCVARNCDRLGGLYKAVRVARQFGVKRAIAGAGRTVHLVHVSAFSHDTTASIMPGELPQHVVPNPIDVAQGIRTPAERNEPFVFVGRFVAEKGIMAFARAVLATGVRAIAIGDGPLREEFRRLCPQAETTGWVDGETVNRVMRSARALVFPSRWNETGSLVGIEASANGLPVIASEKTAAGAFIRASGGGITVPMGDDAALAAAINRLRDPVEAERLSRRAYDDYWAKPLDRDHYMERIAAVYAEALNP